MRRLFFLCLTALLAFLIMVPTVAQDDGDNPPSLCNDGTWFCPDPNDSWREAWNWACGWSWGHYYAGLTNTVLSWCKSPESGPTCDPSVDSDGDHTPDCNDICSAAAYEWQVGDVCDNFSGCIQIDTIVDANGDGCSDYIPGWTSHTVACTGTEPWCD